MKFKTSTQTIVLLVLSILLFPFCAEAQFEVYEAWDSGHIRSDRWRGREDFGGQEVVRQVIELTVGRHHHVPILGSFLQMRHHLDGFVVGGTPTGSFQASNVMQFADPTSVTGIGVVFKVTSLKFRPCAANNAGATTRARPAQILLTRFNDGTSAGAGDRTGDIFGGIQAQRDGSTADAPGVLTVVAFINRFTAPNGSTNENLANAVLGTVKVGSSFALELVWDQPNKQFLFRLNEGAATALAYAVSDSSPAVGPFADFRQNHTVGNCDVPGVVIDSTTLVGEVSSNSEAVIP